MIRQNRLVVIDEMDGELRNRGGSVHHIIDESGEVPKVSARWVSKQSPRIWNNVMGMFVINFYEVLKLKEMVFCDV